KYFSKRTTIRIPSKYAIHNGLPNEAFFAMFHTDDKEGNPVHYFFTAREIVREFREGEGEHIFRLTKHNSFESAKISRNEICAIIRDALKRVEPRTNRRAMLALLDEDTLGRPSTGITHRIALPSGKQLVVEES